MQNKLSFRLVSLLALGIYATILIGFALFVLRNILFAIIFGITLLLLCYAGWLLFSRSSSHTKSGRWLTGVAGAAVLAELVYLFFDQQSRRTVIVLVGMSLLYFLLLGWLRKRYWSELRQQGEAGGAGARFNRPYLIINPKAGSGRAAKARIAELAATQGIQVIMTKKGVDVAESALEAVEAGADVIGISGGDGSIGAVAKVAIDHDLPVVVLAGGTRCHFARDLGLSPAEIADGLSGFTGVERRVDVGEINGRIFLNNASFGLYADIVDHKDYREHKLQVTRAVLQDIVAGKKKPYDLRFRHEGKSYKHAVQILVGINRYNTVNMLELGHRERLDEGVVQVSVVTKLTDRLIKKLLATMSVGRLKPGEHTAGLMQWVDTGFAVTNKTPQMVVGVDGEREVHQTPVKVHILPGALRVYVPAEGVRGRRKNPLSVSLATQMAHEVRR